MADIEHLRGRYPPMEGEYIYRGHLWVSWVLKETLVDIEEKFQWRDNDVLIATFPKSGTTLLQEIIWLLENQTDFNIAGQYPIHCRVPFIEENYQFSFVTRNVNDGSVELSPQQADYDYLESIPQSQRRIIKTHLPFESLERAATNPNVKILYCLRNPKDVLVSYYHFYKGAVEYGPYTGSFQDFFSMWMDGWMVAGDWLTVVSRWWTECRSRNLDNVMFVFYEDLVENSYETIKKIKDFIQPKLPVSDEQIQKIVEHCKFENMQKNKMVNYEGIEGFVKDFVFMRKGQIGDWKNWLTVAQNEYFDHKHAEALKKINLNFKYSSN